MSSPSKGVRNIGIFGGGVYFGVMSISQPFFSLYAEQLGASTAAIGLMVTLRALVPMFIAMPIGQLIDTVGAVQMARVGSLLMIASLALVAFSQNIWVLGLSQIVMGASIIIIASSLQVLASEGHANKAERNKNINRYSMWSSFGSMAGPLIGGLLVGIFSSKLDGYRFSFVFSMAVCLIAFLLVWWVSRADSRGKLSREEKQEAWEQFRLNRMMGSYLSGVQLAQRRGVQFGLIGTFLIMFIQALYMSFIPLFLNRQGYSAMQISIVVSMSGLAGLSARFLLNLMMKKVALESILIGAGIIASVCLMCVPLASFAFVGICLLSALMGAAIGINLPVSMMIMVDDTGDSERGKVMGLRLLSNRVSQLVSPALFGVLGQSLGLTLGFYAGGGLLLATMLGFAAYHSVRKPAVAGESGSGEVAGSLGSTGLAGSLGLEPKKEGLS